MQKSADSAGCVFYEPVRIIQQKPTSSSVPNLSTRLSCLLRLASIGEITDTLNQKRMVSVLFQVYVDQKLNSTIQLNSQENIALENVKQTFSIITVSVLW